MFLSVNFKESSLYCTNKILGRIFVFYLKGDLIVLDEDYTELAISVLLCVCV